jgi:hypothetical protein
MQAAKMGRNRNWPLRLDWERVKNDVMREVIWEKFKNALAIILSLLYRNRKNRASCTEKGIRLSGLALGRPPKEIEANREELANRERQAKQDEIDRIPIEEKFGQAKRRFGLSRVMAKLATIAELAIVITFLVMNLEKWLKGLLFGVCFCNKSSPQDCQVNKEWQSREKWNIFPTLFLIYVDPKKLRKYL